MRHATSIQTQHEHTQSMPQAVTRDDPRPEN
jgi:hypothetical protein